MNAQLPLALAQSLAPFAPANSVVHQIVNAQPQLDSYRALAKCLDADERRRMRLMVIDQNNYIERTGGFL